MSRKWSINTHKCWEKGNSWCEFDKAIQRSYRHPVAENENSCQPCPTILSTISSFHKQDPQITHQWFCSPVQNCKSSGKPQKCDNCTAEGNLVSVVLKFIRWYQTTEGKSYFLLEKQPCILDEMLWTNTNLLYIRRRIWVLSLGSEWVKLPARRIEVGVSFSNSHSKTPQNHTAWKEGNPSLISYTKLHVREGKKK